jgi:SAM-dependent methyltransferase
MGLPDLATALKLRHRLDRPELWPPTRRREGNCEACGAFSRFEFRPVISAELAATARWPRRTLRGWNKRESLACTACYAPYRFRRMARAIVRRYGEDGCESLVQLAKQASFRRLSLLALDDPLLVRCLEEHPGLHRSRYFVSLIPGLSLPNDGLTYQDGSFDLAYSLDVLEHTPHYLQAIREVHRVLKSGGVWLTSLPLLPERATRTRALINPDGSIQHLLPPSHHARPADESLVFVEFGLDFLDQIEAAGFQVRVSGFSFLERDYSSVFVCEKR